MKFYSTQNRNHLVSLRDAVIHGLAPDNGLYMPEFIPSLDEGFFKTISDRSFQENSVTVLRPFLEEDLTETEIRAMVNSTLQFDAPLIQIDKNIFALELFHGPTLAFKDFGARFMSQLLGSYSTQETKDLVILVATSGDTGSAVANGFLGVHGIRVVVLYPSGKVSDIQEKQFTTLGQNVIALEIDGTFDDCQRLVKLAFLDKELNEQLFLTSANSINIARLLPQMLYYFHAFAQLPDRRSPVVISVPSGNFGNLTAGIFAKRMGLPIDRFVVSTNANDVVPEFLRTKVFSPRPSRATISNAMDVGNPSNFARLLDLYHEDHDWMGSELVGFSFSDVQTREVIRSVFVDNNYALCPHSAVGYAGIKTYLTKADRATGIFLATAHPAKFREVVEPTIGSALELPDKIEKFLKGRRSVIALSSNFRDFKEFLKK